MNRKYKKEISKKGLKALGEKEESKKIKEGKQVYIKQEKYE